MVLTTSDPCSGVVVLLLIICNSFSFLILLFITLMANDLLNLKLLSNFFINGLFEYSFLLIVKSKINNSILLLARVMRISFNILLFLNVSSGILL